MLCKMLNLYANISGVKPARSNLSNATSFPQLWQR